MENDWSASRLPGTHWKASRQLLPEHWPEHILSLVGFGDSNSFIEATSGVTLLWRMSWMLTFIAGTRNEGWR